MSHQTYLKFAFIISLISLGCLSGCATIVKGTTQEVPVASDPPGADVTVDGQLYGQTPIDISMKRKRDHLVTISIDGHEPKSIPVVKSVGGAVWGNILAGGLIGWGVDATSGAQYNLSPESISVKLTPADNEDTASTKNDSASDFVEELNGLDELKEADKISDEEYASMRTALFKKYYPELDLETVGMSEQEDSSEENMGDIETDPE